MLGGLAQARIIADAGGYVVVNKPSGVQVPATIDNILESVGVFAAEVRYIVTQDCLIAACHTS